MQTEVTVYWIEWFTNLAFIILGATGALFLLVLAIIMLDVSPRDATDSPNKRSGLSLKTDYGTGCEYLSAPGGGITPRMTGDGKHMGCR